MANAARSVLRRMEVLINTWDTHVEQRDTEDHILRCCGMSKWRHGTSKTTDPVIDGCQVIWAAHICVTLCLVMIYAPHATFWCRWGRIRVQISLMNPACFSIPPHRSPLLLHSLPSLAFLPSTTPCQAFHISGEIDRLPAIQDPSHPPYRHHPRLRF